jgi:hypothetical protein
VMTAMIFMGLLRAHGRLSAGAPEEHAGPGSRAPLLIALTRYPTLLWEAAEGAPARRTGPAEPRLDDQWLR